MSVWDYIKSIQEVRFDDFEKLIYEDCNVYYEFNGKSVEITGKDFVNRLKIGHFDNTTKTELISMEVAKLTDNRYSIIDDTIYHRLGLGRDEEGPGKYQMSSDGVITFSNGKIVEIQYTFTKRKL